MEHGFGTLHGSRVGLGVVAIWRDNTPMEYRDERDLNIYTDGSSYSGPRRGGVGILYVVVDESGEERVAPYPRPGYVGATNQQTELRAAIDALESCPELEGCQNSGLAWVPALGRLWSIARCSSPSSTSSSCPC